MVNLSHLCFHCFKDKGEYEVCPHCGYSVAAAHVQPCYLQPGMILSGRYIIGTVVGSGGFGITYKAYDAKMDMVVAIKEFYPVGMANRAQSGTQVEIFTRSQEDTYQRALERFLNEAKNMAVFSNEPDIVGAYDYFEENGTAYIVMEFVEGILLKNFLKEYGPLSQTDVVTLFLDILKIIVKLHEHGFIHQDISPDNFFVQEGNKVKIIDFGATDSWRTSGEEDHEVIIKTGYAPPEQYRKDNKPKATLDVYAAGALLYEMLTGERPLAATDRIIQDELAPPSKMGIETDENLERAVLKAMALEPEKRFQSIQEFYDTVAESRPVELEEPEKIRSKYLVIQRVMLGILSLAAVAAGVFIFFYKTNLVNYTPEDGTHLEVWLVQDPSMQENDAQEMKKNIESGFEERYPSADVEVIFVPKAEYAGKLKETPKSDMPDVFCADYLEESRMEECAGLSALVKHLDAVMYLFTDQYESCYPQMQQIPVGFQMAVYYKNVSKEPLAENEKEKIERERVEKLVEDESCRWLDLNGSEKSRRKLLGNMTKNKTTLNSVAGSLSCWSEVQNLTVSGKRSSELQIIPVVESGKLLCTFQDSYAVRKRESKNQEKTSMLFLYYLLGNTVQREISFKQKNLLPVNAKAYQEYMDNLTQYQPDYIEGKIQVSGDGKWKMSVSDQILWNHSGKDVYEVYSGIDAEER